MNEQERSIVVERWTPVYEEQHVSSTDQQVLIALIGRLRDDGDALLTIESGDNWLGVNVSQGLFHVTAWLGEDVFVDLVGDRALKGRVPFVVGGQQIDLPWRYIVTEQAALVAALEFFRDGNVDLGVGWEQQGPESAWQTE